MCLSRNTQYYPTGPILCFYWFFDYLAFVASSLLIVSSYIQYVRHGSPMRYDHSPEVRC